MICPRCKKQIPKNTINCPHCDMKIGTICQSCHAYNLIYNKACIECGEELIKFCPNCKSANFPNTHECRKCGYIFKHLKRRIKKTKAGSVSIPKEIIVPPRQFVLPVIIPETKSFKGGKPISPLNEEPSIVEEILEPQENILPEKASKLKNKLIKAKKKKLNPQNEKILPQNKLEEKEDVQIQLAQMQEQLINLQQQLKKTITTEVPKQPEPEIQTQQTEPSDEVKPQNLSKPKTTFHKTTEESKISVNKDRELSKKQSLKNAKKLIQQSAIQRKTLKPKGILPFKRNVLPNQRNVKPLQTSIEKINKIIELPKKHLKIKTKSFKKDSPQEPATPTKLEYSPNLFTQQSAKNVLINLLLNTPVTIISLNGESGIGKNVVLRATIEELKDNHFVWLIGKASTTTRISPCGLIQDILLTFFNIPNFSVDTNKLKKDSFNFFKHEFPSLKNEEITELLNFLYPEKTDFYENIYKNKTQTFKMLKKVFETITSRVQTVFVIDNFEYIDKMSYEFLKTLINPETGLYNTKFVLTYEKVTSVKNYFFDKLLDENAYADISLVPFNDKQTDNFIDEYNPLFAGATQSIRDQIQTQTNGNPAYIEQILNLLIDTNRNYLSFELPKSFDSTIKQRLEILSQENSLVYEILIAASAMGMKFYPVILNQLLNVDDRTFLDLFSSLLRLNYIIPVSDSSYEFKSNMLFKSILEFAKTDKKFAEINEKLFVILSSFTLSTHAGLAQLAINIGQTISALKIYSDVVKLSSAIGDIPLYITAQKESLILVEKLQGTNSSLIKTNIYERLGKVLAQENPKEAVKYLPKVISILRKLDDPLKEFELTAYLANCCYKINNYYGVIECIDDAVSNIDISYELEIAMLKTRKLDALYKIGNYGEVVDIIDLEVMPILERHLDTSKSHKIISIENLFETWLKTYLLLADSLVLQGDNRSFNVIATIFDIIAKNKITDELFICKTKLAQAFAYTIKGETEESENILSEITSNYPQEVLDNSAIVKLNLINILNRIITSKYEGLQDDLFEFATFVNNIDDKLTKNILKLLLGKVLKENGRYKQALTVYTEQINYFAKEKNAIGVLFAWYLISELALLTEGAKKSLEFSLKALDIAQSPKIQNFYFITRLNKIIAEAYLINYDFESSKIYIESAIGIARQFELLDVLAQLYWGYGKYLQELAVSPSKEQKDYILSAFRMYDKSINLAQTLKNTSLSNAVMKSNTELRRYCQQNSIILK